MKKLFFLFQINVAKINSFWNKLSLGFLLRFGDEGLLKMFGNRIDELDANNNCCDAHDDDMDDDNCDESRRRCSKRRESLDRDRSRPDEGIVR
jgi:hypothetical protein